MDSPQSVVSAYKSSVVEVEKQQPDFFVLNSGCFTKGIDANRKEAAGGNLESFVGSLEVFVHRARDIHNICIYHKQDVYAKVCLTSDPELAVSTKTINGGGQNPVFNDNLRLNVRTLECSLKCEIWMLSRVKNYLEDQLLGFALVPLSEVILKNGQLDKEFSLSSTDLFHSPAGFVHLSLSYTGASPEVMAIPAPPTVLSTEAPVQESQVAESDPCELDKIEFPDPNIVNENQMMVSEYFGISCDSLDSQNSESLVVSDENELSSELGVHAVESISTATVQSVLHPVRDSPPSSVSTNGVSSPSVPASSQSSDAPVASKYPSQEENSKPSKEQHVSTPKDQSVHSDDRDSASSVGGSSDSSAKPLVTVNMEPEQKVVQQDFVDMYMKSMQQFTESLAKMKLPMDIESEENSPASSTTPDQNLPSSKSNGSRVFYGSRAFF
ncbi:LOW QUALITY PROTEIN: uncharacterized protein LOC104448160 [Eucalyptus grandis]|uniref:LOW QUALITY PROTEIN: uncharacterized protein LOC104448160 n=1 Tax=Eucalyptus grandis TaxID=71139 RepID=UPI00192F111F|nr:LOW QUALITY PROTEIN: uncharacterized protein LOC104448160 [Eucalyptus grandis]